MCDFGPDGLSGGRSPDRLDALVWAVTALMLGPRRRAADQGAEGEMSRQTAARFDCDAVTRRCASIGSAMRHRASTTQGTPYAIWNLAAGSRRRLPPCRSAKASRAQASSRCSAVARRGGRRATMRRWRARGSCGNPVVYRCGAADRRGGGGVPLAGLSRARDELDGASAARSCWRGRTRGRPARRSSRRSIGHLLLAGNAYLEAVGARRGRCASCYRAAARPDEGGARRRTAGRRPMTIAVGGAQACGSLRPGAAGAGRSCT